MSVNIVEVNTTCAWSYDKVIQFKLMFNKQRISPFVFKVNIKKNKTQAIDKNKKKKTQYCY